MQHAVQSRYGVDNKVDALSVVSLSLSLMVLDRTQNSFSVRSRANGLGLNKVYSCTFDLSIIRVIYYRARIAKGPRVH